MKRQLTMHLSLRTRTVVAVALLGVFAPQSAAQDSTALPPKTPGKEVSSSLKRAGKVFETIGKRPLHPIIKGVASGGGPGLGLGFDAPLKQPWKFDVNAAMTIKKYWMASAVAGYDMRRANVEAYGRLRDMSQLTYFGPGNQSEKDNETDFHLNEAVAGAVASIHVSPFLRFSARTERYWPKLSAGKNSSAPNLETVFSESVAPGQFQRPVYWRYQGLVDVMLDPGPGESLQQGTTMRVAWSHYRDTELARFSFNRADLEVQQRFAAFRPYHRFTLHGWVALTRPLPNQVVPFYLLPSLGGKGKLVSVHENLIGTDGSEATLRGYSSFRFRDRHSLLLQAEYRLPLMGPFEGTMYADAGKVASRKRDLGLDGSHKDVGASINLMKGPSTVLRIDVARGSEGFRLLLSIGRDIVP